jgi:hypothetical protein
MAGFLASVFNRGAVADPDPNPGIGGYTTPRGPDGQSGYPGSTSTTRVNPELAAAKLHDGDWGRQDGSRHLRFGSRRMPTITQQQANVIPPPAQNGSLPFQGPDSKTNPHTPGLNGVTDTEQRPRIIISEGIPGGERQRNTVYYGGLQAVPGEVRAYRSAPNPGMLPYDSHGEPVDQVSRYVFNGINGGTDALDDLLEAREMPYTGHRDYRGGLRHARGSRRGAVLDGNRFYQAPDTELDQGGAYGRRARGSQRHRPTIFAEPAPWASRFYDTNAATGGPDTPGTSSQVKSQVHVSASAAPRGWRRG